MKNTLLVPNKAFLGNILAVIAQKSQYTFKVDHDVQSVYVQFAATALELATASQLKYC